MIVLVRRSWSGPLAWALALAAAACQSGSGPSDPGAASPTGGGTAAAASVEVDLNGRSTPPLDAVCSRGLFVSTRVRNLTSRSLRVQTMRVRFESLAGGCTSHTADIDPTVDRALAPGHEEEIRVFDAAGSLCGAPLGAAGCPWHAVSTVATDAGAAVGALDFAATVGAVGDSGCEGAIPVLFTPHTGDVLSGSVAVTASVAESPRCVITARTIVAIYSESGVIVATSPPLDLGDAFSWDTTRVPNGRYALRTRQNCCGIEGGAVKVAVRN